MKAKKMLWGIVVLLLIALSTGIALAANSEQQSLSVLQSGETLNESGFFAGNKVRIDGTVEGTTFAAGNEIRINGTVNGDLFASGQNIYINGTVTGNIYASGMNVVIGSKVEKDVFLAGQNVTIEKDALVERDVFMAGNNIVHSGAIGRNLFAGGAEVKVDGSVGQNAKLEIENLEVSDGAEIKGDLIYGSKNEADISSKASIEGKTEWQEIEVREQVRPISSMLTGKLLSIASALLIWFLVSVWRPDFWNRTADKIGGEALKTIGVGVLVLIATPVLVVLTMATIIGIPLGFIAGIVYGVSIYLSRIVVAVFIGRWIADLLNWKEIHRGVWLTLIGLVILAALSIPQIPIILRAVVVMITIFAGLGALFLSNYKSSKE